MFSRHIDVIFAGDNEYELKEETKIFIVNLVDKTCECKAWQISGIPCKHAVACIQRNRLDIASFIHPSLSKTMYLKTYGGMIHPIPDQASWPDTPYDTLLPPFVKKKPGRPKLSRIRAADENQNQRSYTLKCGVCKGFGHNKRTCNNEGPSHSIRHFLRKNLCNCIDFSLIVVDD